MEEGELPSVEWREVQGIMVSSHGWIRRKEMEQPFLPCKVASGHRIVRLQQKRVKVHDLVACAFIGERPTPQHTVDHISRDRGDNRVSNLRWATKREQIANRGQIDKTKFSANNPFEFRKVGATEWIHCTSQNEACRVHGFSSSLLSRCLSGKGKTHLGCEFRHVYVANLSGEEWVELSNGFVSNMGRIKHKSCPPFTPRICEGMEYAMFAGKVVHRLVAFAFLGSPPLKDATVDHINRDKSDNRASNLRWATRVQQRQNQDRPPQTSVRKKRVRALIDGEWQEYESAIAAERLTGVMAQNIAKCAGGKRPRAGGFEWEYVVQGFGNRAQG